MAGLLALTWAVAGCGSASAPGAALPSPAGRATRGASAAVPAAAAGPKGLAQAESRRLLAAVTVPPGSRAAPTAPAAALDHPAEQPQSGDLVDTAAWWTLPLSTADALDWLRTHPPAGVTVDGPGAVDDEPFLLEETTGTRQYERPQLVLALAPLGRGASALRADAQVTWFPERSAAEQTPTGAGTTARLGYRRAADGPLLGARTVTGPAAGRIAVAFDALQVRPPGTYGCGAGAGLSIELRVPPGLVATTESGCAILTVTSRGRPQPTLSLSPGLQTLLLTALHLPPNAPYRH